MYVVVPHRLVLAQRISFLGLVTISAVLLLGASGCARSTQATTVERVADTQIEAPASQEMGQTETATAPPTASPTPSAPTGAAPLSDAPDDLGDAATDLAYADSEPLCVAYVPTEPATATSGAVTYLLTGPWAQYSYSAIYVLNEAGESALDSGEPAVRNGDSFVFQLDDSMLDGSGDWRVLSSIGGEISVPCQVRIVDHVVLPAGGGSTGY